MANFIVIGVAFLLAHSVNSAAVDKNNPECVCTREYFPICGTDGVTYSNECSFDCALKANSVLDVNFYGHCSEEDEVEDEKQLNKIDEIQQIEPKVAEEKLNVEDLCVCALIYQPICANNGITYGNNCEFQCELRKNKHLKAVFFGPCDEYNDSL